MPNYQHDHRRLEREQTDFWADRVRVQNEAQELRCQLARAGHDERLRILGRLAVLKKEQPQNKAGIEAAMQLIKAMEREHGNNAVSTEAHLQTGRGRSGGV